MSSHRVNAQPREDAVQKDRNDIDAVSFRADEQAPTRLPLRNAR
jgi:hypothetical protein